MRYSIVQGPRQSFYNAYSGACRIFCLSFHLGREPVIYEDGRQVRDFVNILDVVDANLLVLRDGGADYETFNVGGDRPYTVREFASAVADAFEVNDYEARPSGKFRFGDTRHICSDVAKLKRLGWKPTRSIRDSIEAYRGWLTTARNAAEILDYCNLQMAKLNVVREVAKV
jgi:dTDP-L-rhamnose 4-epimerase